jgi:hypothetical protein
MPQSDQTVQNAAFPTVRADINDNLAALFSQSSGASAPAVTVAFQPWIDISSSPAIWKVRNATNTGWITIGVFDSTFAPGGVTPIANGGTGETTASSAINALVPTQAGNAEKFLKTDGTLVSWATAAAGASIQVIASSSTYTPTAGKTSFLVFATGGGGGGGNAIITDSTKDAAGSGGGGGGTAVRLYNTTEMGSSASVTIGSGGAANSSGGNTSFDPGGTGLTITGNGGASNAGTNTAGLSAEGGASTNSQITVDGGPGGVGNITNANQAVGGAGGISFWAGGYGRGGNGGLRNENFNNGTSGGAAGTAGVVFVMEF